LYSDRRGGGTDAAALSLAANVLKLAFDGQLATQGVCCSLLP
jgi:hypothetical protein